ncbi:MAG: methyl-accepting chemotaxis protein, partial [Pseudomonadota bacterium]
MFSYQDKSLSFKMLFNVALACLICGSVATVIAIYYNNVEFRKGLVGKAQTIHGRLDVASRYVANQGGLEPMIEHYTEKYRSSDQLTEEDKNIILQQVPIYAAMKIGSNGSAKENYEFRVFSDEPRNLLNQASQSEMIIFNQFLENPELSEIVEDTSSHVTVYRPVRLKSANGCLSCHGNPAKSPWGNGKDILGYQMENWKDGKLHGVFAIRSHVDQVLMAKASAGDHPSTRYLVFFILLGGAIALTLAWFLIKSPIRKMSQVVEQLSVSESSLDSTSSQLLNASSTLSSSTNEQASAIQETSASLEEITSMVSQTTSSAQVTADLSYKSELKAKQGEVAIREMVDSMGEINESNKSIML